MDYAGEILRCLIEADVPGIMSAWRKIAPALAIQSETEAAISLHMARSDTPVIPAAMRQWSERWLNDHGFERHDGMWGYARSAPVSAETVGIASRSTTPGLADKIVTVMTDGLNNARAKGIVEPLEQREAMLTARRRYKFRFT